MTKTVYVVDVLVDTFNRVQGDLNVNGIPIMGVLPVFEDRADAFRFVELQSNPLLMPRPVALIIAGEQP